MSQGSRVAQPSASETTAILQNALVGGAETAASLSGALSALLTEATSARPAAAPKKRATPTPAEAAPTPSPPRPPPPPPLTRAVAAEALIVLAFGAVGLRAGAAAEDAAAKAAAAVGRFCASAALRDLLRGGVGLLVAP
jgi:hypothetical protein